MMPQQKSSQSATDISSLLSRLQRAIGSADLDCKCQEKLNGAIERFWALEQRRTHRDGLKASRDKRDRIAAILDFLSELDQLEEIEPDRSAFEEVACLFEEISVTALAGAAAIRELCKVAPKI